MKIVTSRYALALIDAENLVNELLTVSNDLQVMVDSDSSENFKREFTALWERKNELILRIVREMTEWKTSPSYVALEDVERAPK